jgi:hypothetical protein
MTKPTVHFDPTRPGLSPKVGERAVVWPLDHPDHDRVSNTKAVITSTVVKTNPDGSFETENTLYVPKIEEREDGPSA